MFLFLIFSLCGIFASVSLFESLSIVLVLLWSRFMFHKTKFKSVVCDILVNWIASKTVLGFCAIVH